MNKSYPIWLVIFLALCVAAIVLAGGSLAWFASLPSLLVVLGITVVLSLSSFSMKEIGAAFSRAFAPGQASAEERAAGTAFFEALGRYLVPAGILGTLIGIMTMLAATAETALLGRGMALALTTILYSLVLYLAVVVPFRSAYRKSMNLAA